SPRRQQGSSKSLAGAAGSKNRSLYDILASRPRSPLLFLLPLLLAFLGALLGALAVAGANLGLLKLRARLKRSALAQTRHELDPLEKAHVGDLPHHRPHGVELLEDGVDLVRLGAAAPADAPAPAGVDDVGVLPLLIRHRVDDALEAGHR